MKLWFRGRTRKTSTKDRVCGNSLVIVMLVTQPAWLQNRTNWILGGRHWIAAQLDFCIE